MMSFEEINHNITRQYSVHISGKKLAILLTSSYLFFGYSNSIMLRPTTDESMKDLTKIEGGFFEG